MITASGPEGARLSEERFVYYEKQPPRTPRERRLENEKLLRLRDFLRDRSIEVEIAREGERGRDAAGNRSLTIEPED